MSLVPVERFMTIFPCECEVTILKYNIWNILNELNNLRDNMGKMRNEME
jgi:hypothetical protein